jgi:fumarate hydratase, class II
MPDIRKETDGLSVVEVPADKPWGAQTQRSLEPTVRRTVEK